VLSSLTHVSASALSSVDVYSWSRDSLLRRSSSSDNAPPAALPLQPPEKQHQCRGITHEEGGIAVAGTGPINTSAVAYMGARGTAVVWKGHINNSGGAPPTVHEEDQGYTDCIGGAQKRSSSSRSPCPSPCCCRPCCCCWCWCCCYWCCCLHRCLNWFWLEVAQESTLAHRSRAGRLAAQGWEQAPPVRVPPCPSTSSCRQYNDSTLTVHEAVHETQPDRISQYFSST
jgi:hypothetical protein